MLKKLVLMLIGILFFAATGIAVGSEAVQEGTISFTGPFDKQKALKTFYGDLMPLKGDEQDGAAIWNNVVVPESLSRFFQSTAKGKVRIVFDSSYTEDGIEKNVIVTATVPSDKSYECHACAPLIGAAVFRRSGNGWIMESQNKYANVIGKFGTTENESMGLTKIGPSRYGVVFRGEDFHQGYVSTYVSLLIPFNRSFISSLHFFVEGPGEGACPDAVWKQGIDLKAIKGQITSQGYYDMEASVRYNSGNCGRVKPAVEKRLFKFARGKYERTK
ncbi:MAG: hypothetical protein WCT30_09760 [Desulfurivibrionaceae bacterium]|jgi:hypothetical protein